VTDQVKRTTTFGFDANGRKLVATNAALTATRQVFDARGSVLKATDGASHSAFSAYDAAGNQTYLTNRNGKVWTFYYDAANRLTNTVTPKNRSTLLTFNNRGLVSTIKDPATNLTSLFYDAKGRLTNRTDLVATNLYRYDANDNLTNVTETFNLQPSTCNYTYDAYNQVQTYTDSSGNLIQYKYDVGGNVTNLIYPGNKTVTYAYDSLNRLTNIMDWSGRKSRITYDLASHVTGIVRPNGSYRTIAFDAAGQATNIYEQMSNSLPVAVFRYAWTNTGNMAWEFAAPLPHAVTVPTRTMKYDEDNRLTNCNGIFTTNDANGNLTYAPLTNGVFTNYVYDARNRLLNAGGVTNTYDPAGNRVGNRIGTNTTILVVNPNASLPQVLMRIKNGVTNYYIYGVGLLYQITETAIATNTLTYHYDYRGSTIALSDGTGKVTDRMEYALYGLTTYRIGTNDTPFLFNGKYGVQTDQNGLLYMQARYYNPYLCRFVSSDPSGFNGGLNTYAFANGNPVSLIDPFGLGARESSVDLSWFNAPTAGQMQAQTLVADFVNFATLGTANDATTAITGRDLYGNIATRQEQFASTIMLGMAVVPFGKVEQTASRVGAELGEGIGKAGSGTATLFHHTSGEFGQLINQTGILKGSSTPGLWRPWSTGDIYLSTKPELSTLDRLIYGLQKSKTEAVVRVIVPENQVSTRPFGIRIVKGPLNIGQPQTFP
jgi:RHS repeat-associated protein